MHGAPHFVLFGTPVRVEPTFLLVAAYLGFGQRDLSLILAWVVVLFVGILLHELGHAMAYRHYGSSSAIVLWGFGGLTYGSAGLPPRKHIVVSLAGPLSELFILGVPAWLLRDSGVVTDPFARDVLDMVIWVNVVWAVVNLLPMLPLDGGNITRDVLTIATRRSGERPARIISIITAGALGLYAFVVWEWLFAGIAAGAIVFMNVSALKKASATSSFIRVQQPPTKRQLRARGTATAAPADRTADAQGVPRELLAGGYEALASGTVATALDLSAQILASQPYPDTRRHALELRAWALLREHRVDDAAAAVAEIPKGRKPDRFLRACLAVAGAGSAPVLPSSAVVGSVDPIDDLVDAFLFGEDGPARTQAAWFVGDRMLAEPVGSRLVAAGDDGRRTAASLEVALRDLGQVEAADLVRRRLVSER
jgi:Zn-dependent protease